MLTITFQDVSGPFSIDLTKVPQDELSPNLKILVIPKDSPVTIGNVTVTYCGETGK